MTRLIQLSRYFRGLSEMEPSEAAEQAAIWDGFGLHVIPDADLAEAFRRALENFDDSRPFGAVWVRDAWHSIRRERFERERPPSRSRRPGDMTFAQWYAKDRENIEAKFPPSTVAMMKRLFDKRVEKDGEPEPAPAGDSGVCYYCNDSGWQAIAFMGEGGNENIGLRLCACSKAPAEVIHSTGTYRDRKGDVIAVKPSEPLREPDYRKRPNSDIWEPVDKKTSVYGD